jgi:hypothetical protein
MPRYAAIALVPATTGPLAEETLVLGACSVVESVVG